MIIPLKWSDAGPEGEENHFGRILYDGVPAICTHGGSQWMCKSCAEAILAHEPRDPKVSEGHVRHFGTL